MAAPTLEIEPVTDTSHEDVWRKRLRTPLLPPWLQAFRESPDAAIDLALREEYDFGRQTAQGSLATLLRWVRALADTGDFERRLDTALDTWVRENWRREVTAPAEDSAVTAWSNLFDLVAFHRRFPNTATTLRANFREPPSFLRFRSGADGVIKLYLRSLARTQTDRSLEPYWRTLAALPVGVPVDRAPLAVEGVTGMPRLETDVAGGFRPDVARVTFTVAEALERLSDEGVVDRTKAAEQARRIAASAMTAYPFRDLWADALATHHSRRDYWRDWIGLDDEAATSGRAVGSRADAEGWRDRAIRIARDLGLNKPGASHEAERLLQEERTHARATWNTSFLVKSLTSFASALFDQDSDRAREYALEALDWAPDDPYCHGAYVHALAVADGPAAAVPYAWRAVERFGENMVVWNELGIVLRDYGALQSSAYVFTHAGFLFPDKPAIIYGLAETLGTAGRYADAARYLIRPVGEHDPDFSAAAKWLVKLRASAPLEFAEFLGTQASTRLADIDVNQLRSEIETPERPPTGLSDRSLPDIADSGLARTMYLGDFRVTRTLAAVTKDEDLFAIMAQKLEALQTFFPGDVAVSAEELLSATASEESVSLARDLAERFPRSVSAAYVRARLDRGTWEGRQLRDSAAQIPKLTEPWRKLLDCDAQLAPLFDLGQARALVSVRDGVLVGEAAGAALRSLATWVASAKESDESAPFEASWARSADTLLSLSEATFADSTFLHLRISMSPARLDLLEENFAFRADSLET
jgi:hypothetical protein